MVQPSWGNATYGQGHGPSDGGKDLLEARGIAMEVVGGAEVSRDDHRGGVVDRPEQSHGGAAALQPVVGAAVELQQSATGLFARAPGAVLGRPAAMARDQPEGAPEAAHGLPRDGHAVKLAQFLDQVGVIEAGVAVAQQGLHLGTHRGSEPTRGRPPAGLVAQAGRAPAR